MPRLMVPLLLVLASCSGGCKKTMTAPPVEGLRAADDARPHLVASVTIAPPERTLGKVDALARKLQLPFSGKDLATTVAAGNNLPADVLALLDPTRAIGAAFVARGKDAPPLEAIALTTRTAQAAEQLIAALGTVAETRSGARKLQRPGSGAAWVAGRGTALLVSDSLEGLQAAGALAMEAQRAAADDVVVNLYPEALARSQGTDLKTALANVRKEALEQQIAQAQARGGPVPTPAERLTLEAGLDMVLEPVAETALGALSLSVDVDHGIALGLRMQPKPGSAFATRVHTTSPYALDPGLMGAAPEAPAFVFAFGATPFWLDMYDRLLAAQGRAGLKGAADVAQRWRDLRPHLNGAMSSTARVTRGALTYDVVLPLRGAPGPALDAIAGLVASPAFTQLLGEMYGTVAPQVRTRREDGGVRTEMAFPVRDRPGDPGTMMKALFGSPTFATVVTGAGNRLLGASEPGAKARLAAMARGGSATPPPELATALADTKGADGFIYFDLWAMLRPMMELLKSDPQQAQMLGMMSMIPGLAQLKLPLVISYRGGDALTGELRVPLATLTSAANVLRPFVGGGLGGK